MDVYLNLNVKQIFFFEFMFFFVFNLMWFLIFLSFFGVLLNFFLWIDFDFFYVKNLLGSFFYQYVYFLNFGEVLFCFVFIIVFVC